MIALAIAAAPGCARREPATRPGVEAGGAALLAPSTAPARRDDAEAPARDAVVVPRYVYAVDVFHVDAPLGTYSRDDAFWAEMDESVLPVDARDTLWRNGVRCGLLPIERLDALRERSGMPERTRRTRITGPEARETEIEMNLRVPEQTLFHFDAGNNLTGRSFGESDNLLLLSYEPAPRRAGWVRVSLQAAVRDARARLAPPGESRRVATRDEQRFDLRLRADVPPGMALVLGLSPDGARTTSLGHAMLSRAGAGGRDELALFILPTPVGELGGPRR